MNEITAPTPSSEMRKFRLEECANGWMCVVLQGKDEFKTRLVFMSTKELCDYLLSEFSAK